MRREYGTTTARRLLPLPGFFFEGSAVFTPAAEDICNLWNEACKHGLKRKDAQTHTQTETYRHISQTHDTDEAEAIAARHCRYRPTDRPARDASATLIWPPFPVPVLPLAGLFVVGASVLAARAEDVHDFRNKAGEHRLRRRTRICGRATDNSAIHTDNDAVTASHCYHMIPNTAFSSRNGCTPFVMRTV